MSAESSDGLPPDAPVKKKRGRPKSPRPTFQEDQVVFAPTGQEVVALRMKEIREIIHRMTENQAWDSIQARDINPDVIQFVTDQLADGTEVAQICHRLGLGNCGGKNSKQWKKIAAYFRQGFRADGEAYLFQQTHAFYKVLGQAKAILEDAFENGTPTVVNHPEGPTEIIYVKGATRELASFLKAYSEAIMLPPKLWKEFGAIGDKPGAIPGGVTIMVQNNIPLPSVESIKAHQAEMVAKARAIEILSPPGAAQVVEDGSES